MDQLKITWIIAHQPAYLFYRVASDFKRIVNERSKNVKIDIEILTAEEYNELHSPSEPAARHNLWKFLQNNSVQIAQMQVASLANQCNHQMNVLEMPYIFEDHAHAASVLEGEIGTTLLNSFDKSSNLKGLAYTYSGGFRLMPLNKTVSSLGEIAGLTMRSGPTQISQDIMKSFGFSPVPTEIDEVSTAVQSGKVIGGEHVAQRLLPDQCDEWIKTIIDTKHSLFLTSIVVNLEWWNSLDSEIQSIFLEAAKEAAQNERELSIEDGKNSIDYLKSKGVTMIDLTEDEMQDLKDKSNSVYKKYEAELKFIPHIKNNWK